MGNPGGNQGGKVPSGQENVFGGGKKGAAVETGANRSLELDKTLKEGECRELTKEELALIFQGENRRFLRKEKFKWSNLTKFPKLV